MVIKISRLSPTEHWINFAALPNKDLRLITENMRFITSDVLNNLINTVGIIVDRSSVSGVF